MSERRRAMFVAAAAVLVLVVAVGVSIDRSRSSHQSSAARAAPPRLPERSSSSAPATTVSTDAAAATPSASAVKSSSAPGPGDGEALPSERGDPLLAACTPGQLRFTTVTDKATYGPGDVVVVEFVAVNTSADRCNGPGLCGIGAQADVDGADGAPVARLTSPAIACREPAPLPPALDPGASVAYAVQQTWDHRSCDAAGQCTSSAGTFRAVAEYQGHVADPAAFTVNT